MLYADEEPPHRVSIRTHKCWETTPTDNPKSLLSPHPVSPTNAYLYFDWPGEVADVNKEGDINIAPKVKFFIGEAVLELFNIAAGDNMNLFSRLSTSWGQE